MRVLLIAPIAVFLLTACTLGPRGGIRIDSELAAAQTVRLIDERPSNETTGRITNCANQGKGWQGIDDGAFSRSRSELLRNRLETAFPGRFSQLIIKHFQSCFAIRSVSSAGAVAAVSYAAAVALDAATKKGDDLALTYIEFVLDGQTFSVTDVRPFRVGLTWVFPYERAETAAIFADSAKSAVAQAVKQVEGRANGGR